MRLKRRTFLRGVLQGTAVSVGLPVLDAMMDRTGRGFADGSVPPKRFVLWFWGNGVRRAHWTPIGEGVDWMPRSEMAPLVADGLRPYVAPVSGFEIKTATHPHHSGMTGMLTGARYHLIGPTRDTIVSTFAQPSIDQVVADHFAADPECVTPYRSLEVGICRFRGTDEGTTFQHLSHNGPNNVNASEYAPIRVYNRLFGMPGDAQIDGARRSVLDAVLGDITSLQGRVGARDRVRLEQHFESVRALEQRLSASAATCTRPDIPNPNYPDVEGNEQIREKNAVMSELVAMALACDLTRVASVLFSTAGAGTRYWMVGAQNSFHQICHDERAGGAEPQPTVHAATIFKMEQLAVFLQRLRATPDGEGNLLDNTLVLGTTELSEGYTHSNDEFPIIMAGRAAGAFNPGRHYRSNNRRNTSDVLLTVLRAMGDMRPSFGTAEGETTTPIGELLS
ncbi:MAG: DUF1552 domain-containing protein [Deltaproteobacteria bacterium]